MQKKESLCDFSDSDLIKRMRDYLENNDKQSNTILSQRVLDVEYERSLKVLYSRYCSKQDDDSANSKSEKKYLLWNYLRKKWRLSLKEVDIEGSVNGAFECLEVHIKDGTYEDNNKLLPYLMRVSNNMCNGLYRKCKSRDEVGIDNPETISVADEIFDEEEWKEKNKAIEIAMTYLQPPCEMLLKCKYGFVTKKYNDIYEENRDFFSSTEAVRRKVYKCNEKLVEKAKQIYIESYE